MNFRRLALFTPLVLGFALSACNQGTNEALPTASISGSAAPSPGSETTESNASESDIPRDPKGMAFERELLAAKAGGKGRREIEAATRELMARYGYAVPEMDAPAASIRIPAKPTGLAKAAATTEWLNVRSMNIIFHFAHSMFISVPPGGTLEAKARVVDDGADPILIGFHKKVGAFPESHHPIQVVGYNDDETANTLNSRIIWTNTSASTRSIRLVSFCLQGTYGRTMLSFTIRKTGSPTKFYSSTMWVSGNTEHYDFTSGMDGCIGPTSTVLSLQDHHSTGIGTSLLAYNATTNRGGFIRETTADLVLQDILPNGGNSVMLGFVEGDGLPQPSQLWTLPVGQHGPYLEARYGYNFYFGFLYETYQCP